VNEAEHRTHSDANVEAAVATVLLNANDLLFCVNPVLETRGNGGR